MGVSIARVSQIEHGEVTSFEVIARYVEALGGRLDLVADFGDRTVRLPVSDTATNAAQRAWCLPGARARQAYQERTAIRLELRPKFLGRRAHGNGTNPVTGFFCCTRIQARAYDLNESSLVHR
jgi:hypothetical protein